MFALLCLGLASGCQTTNSARAKPPAPYAPTPKPDPEKINQARETLSQVRNVNDQVAENFYQQGLYFEEKAMYREAIHEYLKALKVKPSFASVLYTQLGILYRETEQYDLAQDALSEALQSNPNSALLYYERGLAHWQKGEINKATQDLERAVAINANFSQAHYSLGKILWDSNKGAAADHFRKFLASANKDEAAQINEIRALLQPLPSQDQPLATHRTIPPLRAPTLLFR